jgi:glycerophosphoryl diester phosphodiesterase
VNGDIKALLDCAKEQNKLIVVAHRGGFAPGFPENALASIQRTLDHIPVVVELDVVSSSDGIDYLHHDNTLDRTTTGHGPYDSKPWSEIQKLKLRDNGYSRTQQHPISFDEMLTAVKGKAFLMLDMKAPSSNKRIIEHLKTVNMLKSTIFIAYNHDQAHDILSVAPSAIIALGASSPEQIKAITNSHLDKSPFVALAGGIGSDKAFIKELSAEGHYALGGSYYGELPPDARVVTHLKVPEYDNAADNGFQLVVTNAPILTYRYLQQHDQAVNHCIVRETLE